jgi:hypothetical protein
MALRDFEDRLERMVEGIFARAFRTGLQPVEIGRRLVKEIDAHRTIDAHSRSISPNRFVIRLATIDHERFAGISESLIGELRAIVREHASAEGFRFIGPVRLELVEDPAGTVGMFRVDAGFDERPPSNHHGYLELPGGQLVGLGAEPVTIGRVPESTIVLSDPNASRHHAELHLEGDSYELIDLGSTNGSRVNGVAVDRQLLVDGDELTFGTIRLRFRLR